MRECGFVSVCVFVCVHVFCLHSSVAQRLSDGALRVEAISIHFSVIQGPNFETLPFRQYLADFDETRCKMQVRLEIYLLQAFAGLHGPKSALLH